MPVYNFVMPHVDKNLLAEYCKAVLRFKEAVALLKVRRDRAGFAEALQRAEQARAISRERFAELQEYKRNSAAKGRSAA